MKKIQAVVFAGMNPWNMREIHDTVRFLAAAVTGVDKLYINPPRGFTGALGDSRYLLTAARWQTQVYGGVTVYTPAMGFAPVFLGLRKMADGLAAKKLDKVLQNRYGPSWRERVLFYISSWSYTQTNLVKRLRPKYLLFHILDDSFAFPLISEHPRVLAENKLFYKYMMAKSDAVIAVSPDLARKYAALYNRAVHVIKNGVNVEHFRRLENHPPVPEMEKIPPPVLMYTGSINSWVDLELLNHLAERKPGYSIVLIGHHYEGTTGAGQWRGLLDKANVYWLKSRPYELLPGYMRHASALLLPRTQAEHSRASDPLKLYEYLSTGKPVVATALPSVEEFHEFVYVSKNQDDFATAVDTALQEHCPDRARRQAAMMEKHSWQARAREIAGVLSTCCGITF